MADFTDKVAKARAAGYTDDEIVKFLSSGEMSAKITKAKEAGYTPSEIVNHLGGKAPQPSGPSDASAALSDPEWAKKGKILYKESNGQDFTGSDQEAAEWLNNYLYDFNYRLVGAGSDDTRGTLDTAAQIAGYSPEGKQAFADAQTQFENMDTTLGGVGAATKRVLTDPTTYAGIGTLGWGLIGQQGAKQAAKKGVTELAKIGAKQAAKRGAAIGAAEGAVYGGVSNYGQQQAMVNADAQDAVDPMQVGKAAGIGGVTGGVLGGAGGAIAGGIAGRNPTVRAARQLVNNEQTALRGAEITQDLADLQQSALRLDPETVLGAKEANANIGKVTVDLKARLKELNLPKDRLAEYNRSLDKAVGLSDSDIAALRSTPEGNAVADHIELVQQHRAMTRQIPNDGTVPRLGRLIFDKYSPVPGAIGDPIKQFLFPARVTAETRIGNMATPRSLKIAQEISRLGGKSDAALSRESLTGMVDAVKQAREAAKRSVDAQKALLKDTSAKLEMEAIRNNEVPGGGKYAYAYQKTGLKPQQVLEGFDTLASQGLIPFEVLKAFDTDPMKLQQGNVLNQMLDRLNKMADDGMLPRDEKWTPNTGGQVQQQGIDAIRYQAGVDQIKGMQDAARQMPVDPRAQEVVRDAIDAMAAAGANQKVREAIFESALSRTRNSEERKQVAQALTPLKEYFKKKYRGNRRAD